MHRVCFTSRFVVGDTFYRTVGQCDAADIPCQICEHTGRISYKEQEWDCPRCHGLGTISEYSVKVKENKVNGLKVNIYDDGTEYVEITYIDPERGDRETTVDEDWVFTTQEEAQADAVRQINEAKATMRTKF
jgi:hypothetical protein